jgi:hypothetical protein
LCVAGSSVLKPGRDGSALEEGVAVRPALQAPSPRGVPRASERAAWHVPGCARGSSVRADAGTRTPDALLTMQSTGLAPAAGQSRLPSRLDPDQRAEAGLAMRLDRGGSRPFGPKSRAWGQGPTGLRKVARAGPPPSARASGRHPPRRRPANGAGGYRLCLGRIYSHRDDGATEEGRGRAREAGASDVLPPARARQRGPSPRRRAATARRRSPARSCSAVVDSGDERSRNRTRCACATPLIPALNAGATRPERPPSRGRRPRPRRALPARSHAEVEAGEERVLDLRLVWRGGTGHRDSYACSTSAATARPTSSPGTAPGSVS